MKISFKKSVPENKEKHQSMFVRAQSYKSDCSLSFPHSWFSRGLEESWKKTEEEKGNEKKNKQNKKRREEKRKERNRKETLNKKLHPSATRPSVGAVGIADYYMTFSSIF